MTNLIDRVRAGVVGTAGEKTGRPITLGENDARELLQALENDRRYRWLRRFVSERAGDSYTTEWRIQNPSLVCCDASDEQIHASIEEAIDAAIAASEGKQ